MIKKKNKSKSIRLPENISPIHYDLTLRPDLESFTFSGKEVIDVNIKISVSKITLHSKDIDVETVELLQGKASQFASKITHDIKSETATFYFKKTIPKGKAKLSIIFSGVINDSLRGFYKSKYEVDGVTKHIATTQFEATDARRAFPCFDEPAHKAIFDVSLIVPGTHTAISNTLPINIAKHEAGYKIVTFAPTPKMSTYLLAFIIGEFEYVEKQVKRNPDLVNKFLGPRTRGPEAVSDHKNLFTSSESITVRVYTTTGKKHQAKFALDVAIRALKFYENYFGIPYPLPTLDMIAIPDFESAAMENWGAITYRETAILVDEEKSSLLNKQWAAIVIAHELAHQWFGNLVTMHWWTDLWLNEGFASYMENVCIDHLFPSWHIWNLNLADRYSLALKLDSLSNSHPIEIEVHHPNEINEIFDMVSYAKGSAIIKMLAEYLGEEKFRKGLNLYLNKHSYKNTETINLWQALEKSSGKPIKKIMDSWTKQTGYPLITMTNPKNKEQSSLFRQERFFSSRVSRRKDKVKSLWQIPLSYETFDKGKTIDNKILIDKKNIFVPGQNIGKINGGEKSFVRACYDDTTLENLKNEIIENRMSIRDRLGVIRDMFALAEGGYIKTSCALEFSLAYKNETEFIVWSEITLGINKIHNLIKDELFIDKFQSYVLSLFSPLAGKMDFDKKGDEKHSDTFLRNLSISMASNYGDKKIISKAKFIFNNRNITPIEKDLKRVVYKIIAQNGGGKEWKLFYKMYLEEKMQEGKDYLASALSSFKDKKLIEKTLDFALSKHVRNQDAPFILSLIFANKNGKDMAWKFLKKNWQIILKRYAEGGHFMSKIISPLENFKTKKDLSDIRKFFKSNQAPGAERTTSQVYEQIESNIAWLKSDRKDIKNWLNKNF